VLLAAAVSRAEVVGGKALAWSLFGLGSVLGAAGTSVALGRVAASASRGICSRLVA
jgi:ABC-type Na+ efflux pump permease subunit